MADTKGMTQINTSANRLKVLGILHNAGLENALVLADRIVDVLAEDEMAEDLAKELDNPTLF